MNNYKAEQLAQDEKFEKEFPNDGEFCCCSREYCYPLDVHNYEPLIHFKSYLLSRDLSLREAFKKDVGEWAEQNKKEVDYGGFIDAVPLHDLLSFLEDYKPETK